MLDESTVASYLLKHHKDKKLDHRTLLKLMYLVDWRAAITLGRQVTDLVWEAGPNGVTSEGLLEYLRQYPGIKVTLDFSDYLHNPVINFSLKPSYIAYVSNKEDKEVLNFVLRTAHKLSPIELSRLVYSTFPLLTTCRFEKFDLVALAKEYEVYKDTL